MVKFPIDVFKEVNPLLKPLMDKMEELMAMMGGNAAEGGEEIEKWDAYKQPTGQHYSPFCEVIPDWWDRPREYIPHQNQVNHLPSSSRTEVSR